MTARRPSPPLSTRIGAGGAAPALAAAAAREMPRAEQGDGDDGERAGGELARGEVGHGSKLRGAA